MRPMEACDRVVFGILAEIDGYRLMFHVNVLNAVYFDSKMNKGDKMCLAATRENENN